MINDLNFCLNKIKTTNKKEYQKKVKKYNLKNELIIDDSDSYLIKKYKHERQHKEYINSIRLKSLRLENKDKYYEKDEISFFEKLENNNQSIFKKKWNSLSYNLKIIKINEYFNKNKISDDNKNLIMSLLNNKKLKKQVIYNIENGYIDDIFF